MLCYLDGIYSQTMATGLTRYSDNLLASLDQHTDVIAGTLKCVVFGYRGAGAFRVPFHHMSNDLIPVDSRLHFYGNALFSYPNIARFFSQRPAVVHYHDVFRFSGDVPGVKSVVTVHDVSSLTTPQWYPRRANFAKQRALRRIERSQAWVIANSENTRQEFLSHCHIDSARVITIPLGIDPLFLQVAHQENLEVASPFGLRQRRYALYVGRYHPRKNIEGILNAFALWRMEADIDLVLAGKGLETIVQTLPEYHALASDIRAQIRFLGYVPDSELANLYRNALCLVYPSWHEGFGLPIVEAMACGCPVVCSPNGALREVAGDVAVLVQPQDIQGMASAVLILAQNEAKLQELRTRGVERAQQFSWQTAADNLINVFKMITR